MVCAVRATEVVWHVWGIGYMFMSRKIHPTSLHNPQWDTLPLTLWLVTLLEWSHPGLDAHPSSQAYICRRLSLQANWNWYWCICQPFMCCYIATFFRLGTASGLFMWQRHEIVLMLKTVQKRDSVLRIICHVTQFFLVIWREVLMFVYTRNVNLNLSL